MKTLESRSISSSMAELSASRTVSSVAMVRVEVVRRRRLEAARGCLEIDRKADSMVIRPG